VSSFGRGADDDLGRAAAPTLLDIGHQVVVHVLNSDRPGPVINRQPMRDNPQHLRGALLIAGQGLAQDSQPALERPRR